MAAHFDKIFDIIVKGLLFTVQKALPLFQDRGSIILTSSVAGSKGFEGGSVYGATKAAVWSFARSVSFLASDDSSYITRAEVFVDGGMAQIWSKT